MITVKPLFTRRRAARCALATMGQVVSISSRPASAMRRYVSGPAPCAVIATAGADDASSTSIISTPCDFNFDATTGLCDGAEAADALALGRRAFDHVDGAPDAEAEPERRRELDLDRHGYSSRCKTNDANASRSAAAAAEIVVAEMSSRARSACSAAMRLISPRTAGSPTALAPAAAASTTASDFLPRATSLPAGFPVTDASPQTASASSTAWNARPSCTPASRSRSTSVLLAPPQIAPRASCAEQGASLAGRHRLVLCQGHGWARLEFEVPVLAFDHAQRGIAEGAHRRARLVARECLAGVAEHAVRQREKGCRRR